MSLPDNDRIADPLDRAAAETERAVEAALTFRQPEGPAADGECHNCGETVAPGLRWCNAACRDDWEKDRKRGLLERE